MEFDGRAILAEIEAIEAGEPRTWGQISHLLLTVENSGRYIREGVEPTKSYFDGFGWRYPRTSYTSWLRSFAEKTGIKTPTLWRYLSSGRYYQQLIELDLIKNLAVPLLPLEQVPESISPESLELLLKIARVAPTEQFVALAEKVLSGNVTRSELRGVWNAYRPVLDGETARGRGTRPKQLAPEEMKHRNQYYEATACNALLASQGNWLGHFDPRNYSVFFNISTKIYDPTRDLKELYEFDAVATVKTDNNNVTLHGIEITTKLYDTLSQKLTLGAKLCDYSWIISNGIDNDNFLGSIPENVGILVVEGVEIHVLRQALGNMISNEQVVYLAKALLAKVL